jgi:DNA-binding transcriptional ArsR family regulator
VARRRPRLPVPEAVRLFRLLADPTRLRILLLLLRRREASTGEIVAAARQSKAAAGAHLAKLRAAGLVGRRAEWRRRLYRVTCPRVAELLEGVGEG